jgi:hypothetical protein
MRASNASINSGAIPDPLEPVERRGSFDQEDIFDQSGHPVAVEHEDPVWAAPTSRSSRGWRSRRRPCVH